MWKQFIYYVVIIVIAIPLFMLAATIEIRRHYVRTMEENLKHQAELAEESLKTLIATKGLEGIDNLAKELGNRTGTRITVVKPDGFVIGDSEANPREMENHAYRPEIAEAVRGTVGKSLRYSRTIDQDMLYIAIPIMENEEIIGVIRTSLSLSMINNLIASINRRVIYFGVVIFILALIIALFSSRAFTKPIDNMVSVSRQIAGGDFSARITTKTKGELGELSNSLNVMAQRLEKLFEEASREKEEIKSVLSAMIEGVAVLDSQGRIVLANEGFKKIFNLSEVIGTHYWEVVRSTDLRDLVDKVIKSGESRTIEIKMPSLGGENIYVGTAALIGKRKEIVVVLHDITKIKGLEKIKAEFVANVSHELKTPLTTMKGFIETLEDGTIDSKEAGRFLGIIKKHTNRLINLVSDLLLLSSLEDKTQRLEIENVGLSGLISDISVILKDKADKKSLTLEFVVPDNLPTIKGDSFLLEQIFANIIDNAINYTKEGKIKLEAMTLDNKIKIEISDTGIGIPAEHLSRIFERFYRVDKTRSRELGGTGLGLSIVKHIVLAHNGEIDVKSEKGKGTTFTITLPA